MQGGDGDWLWQIPDRDRLSADLYRTALEGVLRGTDVAAISVLAARAVAAGREGPSTLAVASLDPADRWSDAQELILAMLHELGLFLPPFAQRTYTGGDDNAIAAWRRAVAVGFGWCDLSWPEFSRGFLSGYPAWDEQDQMERTLILLEDQREALGNSHDREVLKSAMRTVIRSFTDPPWGL